MIYINRFIDKIKFFEAKNSKDFIIPMKDAKDLHSDITKLLLALQEYEQRVKHAMQAPTDIQLDGGDW
jgi:hypothetical protein